MFVISGPDEEILITLSASVSFWDLMSVMLNGASFYFSFCPATLLLSHWLWSRVTPARVATKRELEGIELDRSPAVSIQQQTDVDEESAPVSDPNPIDSQRNGHVSFSVRNPDLKHVRVAWAKN